MESSITIILFLTQSCTGPLRLCASGSKDSQRPAFQLASHEQARLALGFHKDQPLETNPILENSVH